MQADNSEIYAQICWFKISVIYFSPIHLLDSHHGPEEKLQNKVHG